MFRVSGISWASLIISQTAEFSVKCMGNRARILNSLEPFPKTSFNPRKIQRDIINLR
jgi:hypothetical protein